MYLSGFMSIIMDDVYTKLISLRGIRFAMGRPLANFENGNERFDILVDGG